MALLLNGNVTSVQIINNGHVENGLKQWENTLQVFMRKLLKQC